MEKDEEKLIIFLGKKIDNRGGKRRKIYFTFLPYLYLSLPNIIKTHASN